MLGQRGASVTSIVAYVHKKVKKGYYILYGMKNLHYLYTPTTNLKDIRLNTQ